jgi:sarcosine oxidase subunit beta
MGSVSLENADLIVVGGGIFGSSIAYYFKRDNPDKEVVVYEQNELCSGSTGVAAALMSRVRPYGHVIPLSLETYRVIPELEKITCDPLPVHYNGAIHIAVNATNVARLEEMMKTASSYGIEWKKITSQQAERIAPWLKAPVNGRIILVPGEAITDPYLLGMAFVNASKALGVKFIRKTKVIEILKENKVITGIRSLEGIHNSDKTVLSAGVWSVNLAARIGISLPMAPVRSQYWITEQSDSLFPPYSPTVIIPEANFYARPMGKALLFGIREPNSAYADPRVLPDNLNGYLFSPDNGWNDLVESHEKLAGFFPMIEITGIKNYVAGFSGYTPDNMFIAGQVPGLDGLLIATGCVGAGISVAGGIGLGIARLAAGRPNPFDFSLYTPDRFGIFDPFSNEHLSRCAAARSNKISG